jgi:hypothetical protein
LKPITINKNFCEKYGLWKKRKNPERRKVERERVYVGELVVAGRGRLDLPPPARLVP